MQTSNARSLLATLSVAAFLTATSATAAPNASLVTTDQQALDRLAVPLLADPAVKAARDNALALWGKQRAASTADSKATLAGAIDEVVYHSLRAAAANDPARPRVAWTLAPAYALGKLKVPGSRFAGDNPDRIYRYFAVAPNHRYEIRGQRGARPAQHEFSFEASNSISLVFPPKVVLYSKDIDVAKDGSFVVSADSTPANGRRNHLQLPEDAKVVLIRDTVADWSTDANAVTVKRLDDGNVAARTQESVIKDATSIIAAAAEGTMRIFDAAWKDGPNEVTPFVRPYDWGVPGNVISINRFSLQKDEALVITLAPSGANYMSVQLTDPWSRSIDYWNHSSSLSDHQTRANADGTITFVLSAQDPGVHNWLDNGGLRDGMILARWELFPQPLAADEVKKLVREVRKVKLAELGTALPAGVAKVTPTERSQQLKARKAEFARRIAVK